MMKIKYMEMMKELLTNRKGENVRRKYLRFSEACQAYSMGLVVMQKIAEAAGAMYHVPGMPTLVDADKFEAYMEKFND